MTAVEYTHWLKQARFVARQVAPRHLHDDMVAEGMASLVVSLRKFDSAHQLDLGHYVLERMRWAMLDAQRALRPGSRGDSAKGVFYAQVPLAEWDAAAVPAADAARIDLSVAVAKMPSKRRRFMQIWLATDDVARASAAVGVSVDSGYQLYWAAVRSLRKTMGGGRP